MKLNVEDALTYLPNHMLTLCCWTSLMREEDAKMRLMRIAEEAQNPYFRREALVTLAKLQWAEENLSSEDFELRVYRTPLEQLSYANPEWYADTLRRGATAHHLVYQVCLAFNTEMDMLYFLCGTSEIH
jgi:hypothetical protein